MIAIVNKGRDGKYGRNHIYSVQINEKIICFFKHQREDGLVVCLKKAAKAVDKQMREDADTLLKMLKEMEHGPTTHEIPKQE